MDNCTFAGGIRAGGAGHSARVGRSRSWIRQHRVGDLRHVHIDDGTGRCHIDYCYRLAVAEQDYGAGSHGRLA